MKYTHTRASAYRLGIRKKRGINDSGGETPISGYVIIIAAVPESTTDDVVVTRVRPVVVDPVS